MSHKVSRLCNQYNYLRTCSYLHNGWRKQIKTKLMFCKPLFIDHVRVKGLYEVILEYKNEAPQLQK